MNSRARLCLKVATRDASKEMIGTDLAASPLMPGNGRAYLLGMGRKEDNMRVLRKCYERKMKIFTGDLVKKDWQNYTGLSWEDYRNSPDCGAADFIAGLDYYTFVPDKN